MSADEDSLIAIDESADHIFDRNDFSTIGERHVKSCLTWKLVWFQYRFVRSTCIMSERNGDYQMELND